MNVNHIIKLLAVSLLICSCKRDLEPQESVSDGAATPTETVAGGATAVAPPQVDATMQTVTAPQSQAMPAQPAAVAAGMNPAHGQPNHRCDIAVGAPLNSPQKMASTPAMTINPNDKKSAQAPVITNNAVQVPSPTGGSTPAMLNPNAAPANVATAAGMNPPHGQDGHRCDIAVGQPLPKT